jgi:ribonuclease BN (tRNA processing enzyme)
LLLYTQAHHHGTERLVYTGDTGPCPQVQTLARDADLFLCETTHLETDVPAQERGHLTPREAEEAALQAGVRRLLLTHISQAVDSSQSLEAARAVFPGEVSLAEEGQTYEVSKG